MSARLLAVAMAAALATWLLGWWGVVIVSAAAGVTWREPRDARVIALASALAWTALLALDARGGRLLSLATALGGVFRAPGAVLLLLSLLFAAALSWSAAAVAQEVVRVARRSLWSAR